MRIGELQMGFTDNVIRDYLDISYSLEYVLASHFDTNVHCSCVYFFGLHIRVSLKLPAEIILPKIKNTPNCRAILRSSAEEAESRKGSKACFAKLQ